VVNDALHARYEAYLRRLADRMVLADWAIVLARWRADADAHASVSVMHTKNRAIIELSDGFEALSLAEQREHCVHELIHCHLERACHVWTAFAEARGDDATKMAQAAFLDALEIGIDALARAFAPALPLLDEPED
jgi:hypothetical protein